MPSTEYTSLLLSELSRSTCRIVTLRTVSVLEPF